MTSLRVNQAHLARALLHELARREPPPPPPVESQEEARELRDDDLGRARDVALVHAHRATLSARVTAAVALDRAPIVLDDGTRMSLDETERVLADKEERRTFAPLRHSLERAREAGMEPVREAAERFQQELSEVLEHPREELASPKDAAASLDRLLADLKDAATEARSALAREGRAGLEDPVGLARGLDLPDPAGFADGGVRRLGRALLEATGEHRQRAMTALRVPRSLSGLVVTAEEGAVRVGTAPSARASRYLSLVAALGAGVAVSLLAEDELSTTVEDEALLFGAALSFGASSAVVRRAVFDETSAEGDRRARILAATRLVRAQTVATAARVLLVGEGREALRDALGGTLGTDPPAAMLDAFLEPPWPGGASLRGRAASLGAEVVRLALGASVATALRDRYDEAFPLVPSPYELFGGARDALVDGAVTLGEVVGARADVEHPGSALVAWTAELL